MLLSRVGKKSKLTTQQTKTSKLTLSCFSVNIFVQEIKEKLTLERLNKRQTRRAQPSFPRRTPSSLFFESTADFGHVPGVRLQVLDDFSTACAWTGYTFKHTPRPIATHSNQIFAPSRTQTIIWKRSIPASVTLF